MTTHIERRTVYQVRVVVVRLDLDYDPEKNESTIVDEDVLAFYPVSPHSRAEHALNAAEKARNLAKAEMDAEGGEG